MICELENLRADATVPKDDLAEARYLIATALLSLVRAFSRSRKGEASDSEDAVILAAMYVAQHEGRPFRLAKLAYFTGVPRTTLIRRIKSLEERKLIEVRGRYLFVREHLPRPAAETDALYRAASELYDVATGLRERVNRLAAGPRDRGGPVDARVAIPVAL
jgi:hypothetical protein